MADEKLERVAIAVAEATVSLTLDYPDGSRVELTMPKPATLEGQTSEQADPLVRRLARRLLGVAAEDLGNGA
jgi:hypothetical protein